MSVAKEQLKSVLEESGKVEHLERAWSLVREAAFDMNPEMVLSRGFSPQAIERLLPLVAEYEKEINAELEAQQKIERTLESERAIYDDEVLFELDSYAQVFVDGHVEVVAVNVKGLGERLPKRGRKYVGDYSDVRWRFADSGDLAAIRQVVDIVFDQDGNKI